MYEQWAEAIRSVHALRLRLGALEAENKSLRAEIDAAGQRFKESHTKLIKATADRLLSTKNEAAERVEAAEARAARAEAALSKLRASRQAEVSAAIDAFRDSESRATQRAIDDALECARREHGAVVAQAASAFELAHREAQAGFASAVSEVMEVRGALESLRKSNGHTVAQLERANAEISELKGDMPTVQRPARAPAQRDSSARTRQRRIKALEAELEAAREVATTAQQAAIDARSSPTELEARRQRETSTLPRARLRVSDDGWGFAEAPLEARTLEHLRALVEETNMSLNGASTANALLLQLQTGHAPALDRLTCRSSVTRAFQRLGALDRRVWAAANEKEAAYWALSTDGGNKGRAIQMMAVSIWSAVKGRPEVQLLGASDLFVCCLLLSVCCLPYARRAAGGSEGRQ